MTTLLNLSRFESTRCAEMHIGLTIHVNHADNVLEGRVVLEI